MPAKQVIRYVTDLLMTLDIIALMAFSVTGQELHEWLGITALVLFCVHLFLNRKWFVNLTRGSYTPYRLLQTALVFMLLLVMFVQAVSGIAMSGHAVPFIKLPVSSSDARLMHLCCAYWCFVVVSLHLGIHWSMFMGLGRRLRGGRELSPFFSMLLRILALLAAAFGLYSFIAQGIVDYMLLRSEFAFFDFEKPALLVLFEAAAMMSFWTGIGYLMQRISYRLNAAVLQKRKER